MATRSRGWRCPAAVVVLASALPLAACTSAVSPDPGPSVSTSTSVASVGSARTQAAQATLDDLVRSARAGDRPGFDRTIAGQDPSFADQARQLYGNLSTLPLDRLQFRLRAATAPLTPARSAVLGTGAWRQQATVGWRLSGEDASAEQTVWLTFVPDGPAVLLAGTLDQDPGTTTPEPVWWTGPVTAVRGGDLTVLTGAGQSTDVWLDRLRAAVAEVRRSRVGAARGWSGAAVLEVPASRADFEQVVGAAPGSYADIAAVTLAEGTAATSAVRVVVNPELTGRLADLAVAVLLTHEVVHVATRSADSPAPRWAVEGLADYVAFGAHPQAAAATERLVQQQVRQHGAPSALPADAGFGADRPDLDLRYAEAWLACRYVADTYSAASLRRLYAALDAGTPLDRAAEDTLGVSAAGLTAGWRRQLVRQAGG